MELVDRAIKEFKDFCDFLGVLGCLFFGVIFLSLVVGVPLMIWAEGNHRESLESRGCAPNGEQRQTTTMICQPIGNVTTCNPVTTTSRKWVCPNGSSGWL